VTGAAEAIGQKGAQEVRAAYREDTGPDIWDRFVTGWRGDGVTGEVVNKRLNLAKSSDIL